jgi:hypothetical protein
MRHSAISRRTLLRSIGTATIALPLLEEMLLSSATATAEQAVPVRAFNLFFGLGIPAPLQAEGYDGVLEPLKPLSDKLLIMRGVNQLRCDEKGSNAHYDGAIGAFTAEAPQGEAKAGGPSIDQVIRNGHYPDGLPAGMVPTLIAGTFFRRSRVGRYVHSYNEDGTVAATIQEKPRGLFSRVFGSVPISGQDSGDVRRQRLKQSVLDTVVEDYRFYTGANSPLGAVSKARVADHLDRIREYEQRAFAMQHNDRNSPPLPPRSDIPHGGPADPGGQGIDITLAELTTEWRLMADLYALAIQLDRVRFGSLTFLAAGERIRLKGDYEYEGRKIWHFDDAAQLKASGDQGCSHEWWHQYREDKPNEALRAHAHMKMNEVAYFLKRLDAPDCIESNGKSILENSLITISTESGDGRHNDVKRELSGVFHAMSSAGGRLKVGETVEINAEGLDLYNTALEAMDVTGRLGPADRPVHRVDTIRA